MDAKRRNNPIQTHTLYIYIYIYIYIYLYTIYQCINLGPKTEISAPALEHVALQLSTDRDRQLLIVTFTCYLIFFFFYPKK